jgi:hypothetical protein
MGTLNEVDKNYLAQNFLAFFRRDYKMRGAGAHRGRLGAGRRRASTSSRPAIRTVCEPIFDRPLKDISFGKTLLRLFQTARRFNVEIQPQLVLLQKTLLNIEGLGRQLDPELDLWKTAKPFLERWMASASAGALVRNLKREAPQWAAAAAAAAPGAPGARPKPLAPCASEVSRGCARKSGGTASLLKLAAWAAGQILVVRSWFRYNPRRPPQTVDFLSPDAPTRKAPCCSGSSSSTCWFPSASACIAATRVHNAKDFAVAGRSLPLPVVTATVFATWFGAEAVFGVSATFVKEGLRGVVADPFGSSLCLVIAGILFFALPLQAEHPHARRLLPHALQPHGGGDHHDLHRRLLPGLGGGADQGARPDLLRRHRRRGEPEHRHDPRRGHRADLHHLRRHVLGGDPRLRADGGDRWAACSSSPGSSAARSAAAPRR